ncbi:hypothetical protein [Microvirga sp. Mcv34]|uniref:hypothetical protein n=1 Tax=Microvirga sp. Mcv34 TaxID=2926016 RepID=UPI0021C8A462|nr:hypothetical protein [Microvirga sp. Mcv34]
MLGVVVFAETVQGLDILKILIVSANTFLATSERKELKLTMTVGLQTHDDAAHIAPA